MICVKNEKEKRTDEIVYDEGFRSPSNRIEKAEEAEPIPVDEQKSAQKSDRPKPLLITIQLLLCLVIALSLFLLKSMGSELYDEFESRYNEEMKKTLISQSAFDNMTPQKLFSSATADEAQPQTD